MTFSFITEIPENLTVLEAAVSCYNLLLLYFYYDIAKWILSVLRGKLTMKKGGSNAKKPD